MITDNKKRIKKNIAKNHAIVHKIILLDMNTLYHCSV